MIGAGIVFRPIDYAGRRYSGFFPARDPARGPGWYVYGRNTEHYGPRGIICNCARPDTAPRAHPHYNIRVTRGWHTKREATAVAAALNGA